MPFNVAGVFTPLYDWAVDRANGLNILSTRHRDNDLDMAAGLSLTLLRDGSVLPTQNLPMGGKRLTGLGAPVDPNDSVRKAYVDDLLSPGATNIGDYLTTERNPGTNWLKRDGGIYTQASYPVLYTLLGTKYAKFAGFTLGSFGSTANINDMAYGAGLFVAVGDGGMIRTSPTGTSWTARTSGVTNDISRVIFANSQFVATSFGGKILTSPDGITWTQRTSGVTTDLNGIAYGGGKYVICGASGVILVSPDNGVNWIPKSVSGFTEALYGAAYGNGRFVLVGGVGGGTGGASVISLDSGNTFTMSRTGYGGAHLSVEFGKGVFIAEGATAAYMSTSGVGAWQAQGTPGSIQRVKFGLNNFIGVATGSTTSSIDGSRWDTHTAITGNFYGIAFGPSYAMIGGTGGVLAKSNYALDTVTQFQVPADSPDVGYIKAL